MRKTYQILEYSSFIRDKDITGYTSLPRDTFDALENFILSNYNKEKNVVNESIDYKGDFSNIVIDRSTKDYKFALMWSKVFLKGKSFTAFAGSEVAFALLFPMEKLFESYIAMQMRKILRLSEYSLSTQDRTYYLFDEPKRKFLIKPDIVVKNKINGNTYIMDTKWKVLSDSKNNYGISQVDMYQMYAYHKKYSAENVTLIYPLTENILSDKVIEFN